MEREDHSHLPIVEQCPSYLILPSSAPITSSGAGDTGSLKDVTVAPHPPYLPVLFVLTLYYSQGFYPTSLDTPSQRGLCGADQWRDSWYEEDFIGIYQDPGC